jgi:hypothetical protein
MALTGVNRRARVDVADRSFFVLSATDEVKGGV